jgi:hypothetical protein
MFAIFGPVKPTPLPQWQAPAARRPGRPPVKTDWFSWRTEPAKLGVFEHDVADGKPFSWWSGVGWCLRASTPEEAEQNKWLPYTRPQRTSWRGLKNKPKARARS